MPKPEITNVYKISYTLEGESRIQIINLEKGPSYQTIPFEKGMQVTILVSKLPAVTEAKEKK